MNPDAPPENSLVSLFAGAGGMDAGLELAGLTTVLALDNDPDATQTLRKTKDARVQLPDGRCFLDQARIETADITKLTKADFIRLWGYPDHRPTVLAGGPPCQSFSSAGRQRGLDDMRGRLFRDFVRAARALKPEFVVFENVQGLVTARDQEGRIGGVLTLVQETFERAGYACRFDLVNAADYGAGQRRVRLVMLGSRRHALPSLPFPTHAQDGGAGGSLLKPWVALRDALAGLPEPEPETVVTPRPALAEQLAKLAPGQGIRVGGLVEANRPGGHWGYRQDGFLADPSQPARTVRAASTPDWLRLSDGSHRRLTWRECARLQGFPDGWQFVGRSSSLFRQIGNAVPVHIGTALGNAVLNARAEGEMPRNKRPASAEWPPAFRKRIRYTSSEHAVNGEHRRRKERAPVRTAA